MKRMQDMNTADRNMARTLILIVLGTAALVALWAAVIGMKVGFGVLKGRTNPSQNGTPRVYDYADMLTDEQEEALEKKIAAAQKGISADIVIVIALALLLTGAVLLAVRRKKKGSSCCGECGGCGICRAAEEQRKKEARGAKKTK